jgi:hypothetical protein
MKERTPSALPVSWAGIFLCLTLAACGTKREDAGVYGADPGPPEAVSAAAVAEEVAQAQANPSVGLDSFETIVSVLPRARTQRAANFLAAEALYTIRSLPPEQQRAYRERLQAALPADLGGPDDLANPITPHECFVAFDDPDVLAAFSDQAAATFAPSWVQQCATDRHARVEPTVYSHYHLSHEDPAIGGCFVGGEFGRLTEDGNCEPVDHAAEPRTLATHFGDEVIRIRMIDSSGATAAAFDLLSFANLGPAIKLRCRKLNGQWLQWNSLSGNLVWDMSDHCDAVTEVQVTNSGTAISCGPDWEAGQPGGCPIGPESFSLDDFVLRP